MNEKRTLQFELWEECNNRCSFCYLRDGNSKTDEQLKIRSLDSALQKILDEETWTKYNALSYIGGEFFQGQLSSNTIRKKFLKLINETSKLLDTDKVIELWLNATMTIGNQEDLFQCLNMIQHKEKIWLCTSYDTIGRFHQKSYLDTWIKTMDRINNFFPQIKRNVSIILTEDIIRKYLDGKFSFKDFKDRYNCTIFLKTPGTGGYPTTIEYKKHFNDTILHDFFPSRQTFLHFLAKYRQEESNIEYDKIYNINYRADDLYKNTSLNHEDFTHFKRIKDENMNDYKVVDEKLQSMDLLSCGHRSIYTPYVDSDKCFICDKEMIGCIT